MGLNAPSVRWASRGVQAGTVHTGFASLGDGVKVLGLPGETGTLRGVCRGDRHIKRMWRKKQ